MWAWKLAFDEEAKVNYKGLQYEDESLTKMVDQWIAHNNPIADTRKYEVEYDTGALLASF